MTASSIRWCRARPQPVDTHPASLRRSGGSAALVTDGPFAQTLEQLSGFSLVTCGSFEHLVEAAEVLLEAHPVVEIRPVDES